MSDPKYHRWLHACAVLTVCVTLPLLFLGAEVTTKGVGMADPVGYRQPWEIVQAWSEANFGLRIEYGHRLAGFSVGLCAIVLAAGLWLFERRRWVSWLGVLALGLVIVQGLLGRFRVDLNALFGPNLALIHGCFAQLVIATLVSIALFTSRGWLNETVQAPAAPKLRHWTLLTAGLIYGQLVLGAVVRHRDFLIGSRLHLLGAFAVFGAILWLTKLSCESDRRPSLAFALKALRALVGLQIMLGIETWMGRARVFYDPSTVPSFAGDFLRSAHYVLGTLIFSTSVVVALKANLRPVAVESAAPMSQRLEGVA